MAAEAESLFALREVSRQREIPYEIEESLWVNSPQALLRDLHRPVQSFSVNPLEFDRHERVTDGGRSALSEVKQTLYARYRVPMQELLPVGKAYRETVDERKRAMRAPWADAPRFGKQTVPAGMLWSSG